MSPHFASILRQLPSLSGTELQQLRARVGATLGVSGAATIPVGRAKAEEDYLLNGIYFELKRRGLLLKDYLPKAAFPDNFVEKSLSIRTFLDKYCPKLDGAERSALGKLAARALAEYLEATKKNVTPFNMLNNIERIPLALDMSFPGYLKAGLLSFCWRG